MSHLKYMKEINSLTRMDDTIKGPLPRWQKKCLEASNISNISINSSRKVMNGSIANTTAGKTPIKRTETKTKKTPSKGSKKSPSRTSSTPAKTPSGGDRFIPSRATTNFELGYYKIQQQINSDCDGDRADNVSPTKREMQRLMGENLHGGDINNMRVLSYKNKAPAPPEGYRNPLRVVYSQSKTPASLKATTRYIPQAPDRILDAPEIVDDYYLNLVDWSESNILAVALGANVYLWNASSGTIEQLFELEGNDYVCSVAWIQQGPYLAVGTTVGNTELWDCSQMKRVRVMNGHAARVGSLSWNSHVLSSGCRAGQIVQHDVRQRDHLISTINAHAQEVCGLKWCPDGKYLASGGNDNMLQIWSLINGQSHSQNQPVYSLNQHQAAVKALAWCPWQHSILASGGGTADRTIRFWNCNTGACLNTVDTKSQVCSLLWLDILVVFYIWQCLPMERRYLVLELMKPLDCGNASSQILIRRKNVVILNLLHLGSNNRSDNTCDFIDEVLLYLLFFTKINITVYFMNCSPHVIGNNLRHSISGSIESLLHWIIFFKAILCLIVLQNITP